MLLITIYHLNYISNLGLLLFRIHGAQIEFSPRANIWVSVARTRNVFSDRTNHQKVADSAQIPLIMGQGWRTYLTCERPKVQESSWLLVRSKDSCMGTERILVNIGKHRQIKDSYLSLSKFWFQCFRWFLLLSRLSSRAPSSWSRSFKIESCQNYYLHHYQYYYH